MVVAIGRPTKGTEEVELTKVGSEIMCLLTVIRRRVPPGVARPVSAEGVVRPLATGAAGRGPVGGAGDGGKAEAFDTAGDGIPGNGEGMGEAGRPRPPGGPMGGRGGGRGAPMAGEMPPGPETMGGGIIPSPSCGGKAPRPWSGPVIDGVGGAGPSKYPWGGGPGRLLLLARLPDMDEDDRS